MAAGGVALVKLRRKRLVLSMVEPMNTKKNILILYDHHEIHVKTIADFKELSGLGRKQAIVLLEQFDREGITRREGDDRVFASR